VADWDKLDEVFRSAGMPVRLAELDLERAKLPQVIEYSLKNFNADPEREFVRERETLAKVLEVAW